MRQPSYIVMQCYGNTGVFYECVYALLSLARLYEAGGLDDTQIWIYTDNPSLFAQLTHCRLPLHIRKIDALLIKQWRGQIDFVHRVKIEVLLDFTKEREGNILYLDTDIVFTQRIAYLWERLSDGLLLMHTMEGVIGGKANPLFVKLAAHLNSHPALTTNVQKPLTMWNAGVLGLNTRHRHLLEEVLQFTDTFYPPFPKHIAEQFAFSLKFGEAGDIKIAAPYFIHYWNLKEAREVLGSFYNHFKHYGWDDMVRYSSLIQLPALMQDKVNFLANRTIAGKLLKEQWVPPVYDWEALKNGVL